ncbi:MAG: ATP-binding protein [Desulfuromonadales bacterium]|nr:ATP-binding protein [Desulfuromonadales bacterium]
MPGISCRQQTRISRLLLWLLLLLLLAPTLDVSAAREVRIGIFPMPPLNYLDQDGSAKGLNSDLLREIGRDESWTLVFVPGSWGECYDRLLRGEIDLLTTVAYSEERDRLFDFGQQPVANIWGQIYSRPEADLTDIGKLEGLTVAIARKDMNGANFVRTAEQLGIRPLILEKESHHAVLAAVSSGEAVGGVVPQHFGFHEAKSYGLVPTTIDFEPFSVYFTVKKGRNRDLLNAIDGHLAQWKRNPDSYYFRQIEFWMGTPGKERLVIPRWVYAVLVSSLSGLAMLAVFSYSLKRQVRLRTAELASREERFRRMFREHNAIMLLIDPETGGIVDANDAASAYYGYPRDRLIAMNINQINIMPTDEIRCLMTDATRKTRNYFEFVHRLASGELRHVEAHSCPIDVGGEQLLFAIIHDITERKKLMEEHGRAAQLAALGTVAAGVAHEINNPIQGILNYAILLEKDPGNHERIRDIAGRITRESDRIAGITRALLHYAKDNREEKKQVDLQDVITEALTLIAPLVRKGGVHIETEFAAGVPPICVNPQGVQQIVINLVDNAYDALRTTDKPAAEKRILVRTFSRGEQAEPWLGIEISDNGCGMSRQVLAKACDAFFTTKASVEGTGLGLSIVSEIVTKHGGQIEIDSEEGAYTRVKVLLPVRNS